MGYAVTLELPDDVYQPLLQMAVAAHQTPEEWLLVNLRRQLAIYDPKLRRHFGAVNLGQPTGADNQSIDADLAQAYGDVNK